MLQDKPDNNFFKVTTLDIEKLKSLEIGNLMDAESGQWRALRYKNEYVLILYIAQNNFKDGLKDINELVNYLKKFRIKSE